MKVKFIKDEHPLFAVVGVEVGEVTAIYETDGKKFVSINFEQYGGEAVGIPFDSVEVVEPQ